MTRMLFGWTTPALLAGEKTCARHSWTQRTAQQYRSGSLVPAFDRSPSSRGRRLATVRLRGDPVYEPLSAMPDSDYEAEGWRWLHEHPEAITGRGVGPADFSWEAFERWRRRPYSVWVVRFDLVAVTEQLDRLDAGAQALEHQVAGERARLRAAAVDELIGARRIPLAQIDPNPDQPRRGALPEVPQLAAHIATYGLLQPVVVTAGAAGRYTLIAGARRLAAFRLLAERERDAARASQWAAIPAVVRDTATGDRLVLAVAENLARQGLSDADTQVALRLLRDLKGWSGAEIARNLGVSEVWVSRHFAVARDPELSGLVAAERLSVAKAYEVRRSRSPEGRAAALRAALAGESGPAVRRRAQADESPPGAPAAPGGGVRTSPQPAPEVAPRRDPAEVADELQLTAALRAFRLTECIRSALESGSGTVELGTFIRLLRVDLLRAETRVGRAASRRRRPDTPGDRGRRSRNGSPG